MKCPVCQSTDEFKAYAWKLVHEAIYFAPREATGSDIYDTSGDEIVDQGIFAKEMMMCLDCKFEGEPKEFFENGFDYSMLPLNAHNCPRRVLMSIMLRLTKKKYKPKEQLEWIRNIVNKQLNGSEYPGRVRMTSKSKGLAKLSATSSSKEKSSSSTETISGS